ncbi:hypothetical protein [Nocardiopsis oceani]
MFCAQGPGVEVAGAYSSLVSHTHLNDSLFAAGDEHVFEDFLFFLFTVATRFDGANEGEMVFALREWHSKGSIVTAPVPFFGYWFVGDIQGLR